MTNKTVLLFAYGNISRGDDALAPLLLERLQRQGISQACGCQLKYLSDYQIQPEHVLDMQDCERVLLLDADRSIDRAFRLYPVESRLETRYTTHGMSPSTLLHSYRQIFKREPPSCSMLAIGGHSFELGDRLSRQAEENLQEAFRFIISMISERDFSLWNSSLDFE